MRLSVLKFPMWENRFCLRWGCLLLLTQKETWRMSLDVCHWIVIWSHLNMEIESNYQRENMLEHFARHGVKNVNITKLYAGCKRNLAVRVARARNNWQFHRTSGIISVKWEHLYLYIRMAFGAKISSYVEYINTENMHKIADLASKQEIHSSILRDSPIYVWYMLDNYFVHSFENRLVFNITLLAM